MFAFADDSYDFISDLELNPIEGYRIDYSPSSSKAQALLFFICSARPLILNYVAIDMHMLSRYLVFHCS